MKANRGDLFLVLAAYISWGLLPLYWKQLSNVPAVVTLANRVFWSLILLGAVLANRNELTASLKGLWKLQTFWKVALASLLISANWLTYVYAMANGMMIEAGLGYFICPLLAVALGAIFLGEKISRMKVLAILVASMGVLLKVCAHGQVPWVALFLGGTFAAYLTVRKLHQREPIQALFQEVMLACPLVFLVASLHAPDAHLFSKGLFTETLLVLSGPITALPMLWLVRGLRSVQLHTSAMVQFITPTMTILMGLLSGEHLARIDWVAIPVIWLGIALYMGEGLRFSLRTKAVSPQTALGG